LWISLFSSPLRPLCPLRFIKKSCSHNK
jgi:hypothetical protein